jgi:D-alanine--D-alanine ligase
MSKSAKQFIAKSLKIGLICGGPSLERGISLNSARSVLDHLNCKNVVICPIYVDLFKNFYQISTAQLYSNTPADFDFKLAQAAIKFNKKELIQYLQSMDIVFPVIHGVYGEDGTLQRFLESNDIPFIGCQSRSCANMFAKDRAAKILEQNGYATIPSRLLRMNDVNNEQIIRAFFFEHKLERVIIKPVAGGSSIGVFSASSIEEACEKVDKLFTMRLYSKAIIEPFCYGREFTIIVLQNNVGVPTALIPTEIQVSYENGQIFDYRRKYLPTSNTVWHCPPRFDDEVIATIRQQATAIFTLFGMRDFARLDGWMLHDGTILFTDLNPISGMEQNSFIFQQASRIGMTHSDLLWYLICNACRREHIPVHEKRATKQQKTPVKVLFGGDTAERQVSLMSGTNVWLKFRQSAIFAPIPYLLDKHNQVWRLPYTYALNHTVEEIYENCLTASATVDRLEQFVNAIRIELDLKNDYVVKDNLPQMLSFEKFLVATCDEKTFLFLALHGGNGENGVIQQKLDDNNIIYNGSGPKASTLCMDKYLTGEAIAVIGDPAIISAPKKQINITNFTKYSAADYQKFWNLLRNELCGKTFLIKPCNDGCSTGIVRLHSANDLEKYIHLVINKIAVIAPQTFVGQEQIIEMAVEHEGVFLIENFIETDYIRIKNNRLIYNKLDGWLEFTVGVLETKGVYYAFNPSITIAEGFVLSLEEKFQGGTGVNITPPIESIVSKAMRKKMQQQIVKVAKALGIENYARIDVFFNVNTGQMIVIEANTLPGLTPSTVIYHQALAEEPPLSPLAFLEKIIMLKTGKLGQ